ncbi:MAG: GNAT family N-acetyltransferase [Candidatus Kariarchaeaceae archaeon]|jgi:amino-acid N-acetyltransferase
MISTNQLLTKKATIYDLPRIYNLLEELNLPIIGVSDHLDNFFIAVKDNIIVGIIGLEIYENVALLRSVGVKTSYQGQRIGDDLMVVVEEFAKYKSISQIYLFTDTAEKWFERYDFIKISNEDLNPLLKQSAEFSLCSSSVKMVKSLNNSEFKHA